MQQACHKCGFVSDRPTRFCRQCGAQHFVENEATSATTRQYAPQQPANPYDAPYQSQLAQTWSAPDNQFGDQAPDTSRLSQAPMAQNYPNYPATSTGVAKKSGVLKWVLITLICLLLVGGGIGLMVISAVRAKYAAAERARDELLKEIERAKEAARAAEEWGASPPFAPPPPPPLPPTSRAEMEQYKYPGAEVKKSVRAFGQEVMTMTTSDSVSDVRDYYKKRLGDPMFEDEDGASVIFKIIGSPTTIITINEDGEDSDKTQIVVVRSDIIQFPKMN